MDNNIISYFAGVTSLIAISVSICSLVLEKRRLFTEVVTRNRIEWMNDVRNLLSEFLEHYQSSNRAGMLLVYNKLALYMHKLYSPYILLLDALKVCIDNIAVSEENIEKVISISQQVLYEVWKRIKCETGFWKKDESVFTKKIKKEFGDTI